ncbi:MAG: hypothetical protein J5632_06525 [Bacteroidales bacterium]|nr:hypothetical protein [Bacteroidales bacterium]
MKKYFLIFAAAAMTVCFAMSCSKDNGDKKSSGTEQPEGPQGLEDPVNDPNCPFEVVRFVRNDNTGEPIKRALANDWTWEWDGNDYFVTLWDKNNETFIHGEDADLSVSFVKGDDVFQPATIQRVTANKWCVATLRPKALGECILSFNHGSDSVKIKAKVTRKEPYYLGYNSSTALMPDFFTLGGTLNLAWKKNENGVLTNVDCSEQDVNFLCFEDDKLTITKRASSDGKYYYFTINKASSSASFDSVVAMFSINDGTEVHTEFIRFSTFGKSTYEINYDINNK